MAGPKTTIPLAEPVQAYGKTIDCIELRRPTGKEIRDCGYPMQFDEDGNMTPLAGAIARYISKLGDLPMGTVDQIDPAAWSACMGAVLLFFGQSPAISTTSPEKSPESSEG